MTEFYVSANELQRAELVSESTNPDESETPIAHEVGAWVMQVKSQRQTTTLLRSVAGIANKALTIVNLVEMIEAEEAKLGERLTNYLPAASKTSDSK